MYMTRLVEKSYRNSDIKNKFLHIILAIRVFYCIEKDTFYRIGYNKKTALFDEKSGVI